MTHPLQQEFESLLPRRSKVVVVSYETDIYVRVSLWNPLVWLSSYWNQKYRSAILEHLSKVGPKFTRRDVVVQHMFERAPKCEIDLQAHMIERWHYTHDSIDGVTIW